MRFAQFPIVGLLLLSCASQPSSVLEGVAADFETPTDGGTILFVLGDARIWLGESQVRDLVARFLDEGRFKPRVAQISPMFVISTVGDRKLSPSFGPTASRLILMRALDERIARIEAFETQHTRLYIRDVHYECAADRHYVGEDGRVVIEHGLYIGEC